MIPLAICACVKNEAPYLEEWLAFHRLVGVSQFFIYDDGSTDETRELLARHGDVAMPCGAWNISCHNGDTNPAGWHKASQCRAFEHFSMSWRFTEPGSIWVAFIDPDEFLFHTKHDHLPTFLEDFEGYPAVVANWVVFGSNGHKTRPPLTTEAYTRRAIPGEPEPYGRHVKSIVNMRFKPKWGTNGSHCPVFDPPHVAVTQHFKPNPWSMTPEACIDGLRVNHYYHRSEEEAKAKLTKGYDQFPGYPGVDRLQAHERNEAEDCEIFRFLPRLKEELAR